MVNEAITEQMYGSPQHHLQPAPLEGVDVLCEIAALHRAVIDHRESA